MTANSKSFRFTWRPRVLIVAALLVSTDSARAQDHTILFSPTDPGVTRAITNWGLDTCWPSFDNMQRGLIFMGTNNVNLVRVGYVVDAPLTNNDLSPSQKAALQTHANLAKMATAATRWDLNMASNVDPWYQSGAGTIYPDRWAAAMQACQRYYNRSFWMVEGFNEPDYGWGQGSKQNLYDLFGYLKAATNFASAAMAGGSTLNNDVALSWFNAVSSRVSIGTTHCLAGSVSTYVNFLQTVAANNAMPFNPELHNVVEAIIGANYGLAGGIWWGSAELARGEFVKACQGKRLGYAEDWNNWTAAAVYRGTNGVVQGFVGASERMAATTSYQFFSKDRDVFYDGYGPQRAFTVTIPGGTGYQVNQPNAEKVVNITWGANVPPPINGHYILVARHSNKVMGVAGASTDNGAYIQQHTYTNGLNQQWNVIPVPSTNGGDYSFFTVTAVHSGKAADVFNFSYANGGLVRQWESVTGVNQQWFLEYVTNGWFKIRSRWSGKYLEVSGGSTAENVNIDQFSDTGGFNQQWRLIPVGVDPTDLTPPPPPTGLNATANTFSIQLNWNPIAVPDFAGYSVLRATNSDGPFEIVARGLTNNAFTDKSANEPRNYFYVVNAADRSWNNSASSAPVSAMPTLNQGLVARYEFDGNANDGSGNANHSIITAGSPSFPAGKFGFAMDLNGANQYQMLPANLLASVTNFTIAVWVNWDGGAAWQRIFDFGNDTTQYMFLTPSSGNGTLRFAITTNGNGGEQILETSPFPAGQWQHVAITRVGNIARLYTNGVLAVSRTNVVSIAPANINSALNYLGKSQWPDPLLNGRLDEFFIYNYALSSAEIAGLMNNQPPPPVVPTVLSASVSGTLLNFSWPANYIGCRLESNAVSPTAVDSWFTVSGSGATNQLSLPASASASNVFFRLVYP